MHYESGYSYPLLVWLHSDDSSEHELPGVMAPLSTRNYVAVAPRGTASTPGERRVFAWSQNAAHIEAAGQAVGNAISKAQRRFHVNPRCIFLAGFGGGGEMALRLALNSPQSFAGVISVNGPLPVGRSPLRRIHDARKLPMMLVAGVESRNYPQRRVSSDLRLLHAAGIQLELHQHPGGDDLTEVMLKDMNSWIMQRVCQPAGAS